jgi:hypothetical protein
VSLTLINRFHRNFNCYLITFIKLLKKYVFIKITHHINYGELFLNYKHYTIYYFNALRATVFNKLHGLLKCGWKKKSVIASSSIVMLFCITTDRVFMC